MSNDSDQDAPATYVSIGGLVLRLGRTAAASKGSGALWTRCWPASVNSFWCLFENLADDGQASTHLDAAGHLDDLDLEHLLGQDLAASIICDISAREVKEDLRGTPPYPLVGI